MRLKECKCPDHNGQQLEISNFYHHNTKLKDKIYTTYDKYCKEATKALRRKEWFETKIKPFNEKTHKICIGPCGKELPKTDQYFYVSKERYRDGFENTCKECRSKQSTIYYKENSEKIRERTTNRYNNDPNARELQWKSHIKNKYNVTPEWYYEREKAQNFSCAICKTTDKGNQDKWFIDHCHDTNIVRGLLCKQCNTGIGHLKHNKQYLQEAISYLEADFQII